MNLQEKKSSLESLLSNKINSLQQLEQQKQTLLNDIISTQGQIKLLEELIIESKNKEENEKGGSS